MFQKISILRQVKTAQQNCQKIQAYYAECYFSGCVDYHCPGMTPLNWEEGHNFVLFFKKSIQPYGATHHIQGEGAGNIWKMGWLWHKVC